MSRLVLLPSPLLGPAVWQSVAAELAGMGCRAEAVEVAGTPSTAHGVLDAFLAAVPQDEEVVLVPHSNAGLYVPAISARRQVRAAVFVDAALPPVEGVVARTAPPDLYELLTTKADADGLLPPWTQWWSEDDVAALFPDPGTRASVERQQPRLPLSYFRESVPVPSQWHRAPCGYLAFGGTYREETQTARDLGWPVRVLDGDHLEMTVRPRVVAEAILALLGEAAGPPSSV